MTSELYISPAECQAMVDDAIAAVRETIDVHPGADLDPKEAVAEILKAYALASYQRSKCRHVLKLAGLGALVTALDLDLAERMTLAAVMREHGTRHGEVGRG